MSQPSLLSTLVVSSLELELRSVFDQVGIRNRTLGGRVLLSERLSWLLKEAAD